KNMKYLDSIEIAKNVNVEPLVTTSPVWDNHAMVIRPSQSGHQHIARKAPAKGTGSGSVKSRSEGSSSRAKGGSSSTRDLRYFYVRECWQVKQSKSRGGMRSRWRRMKLRLAGGKMADEIRELLEQAEDSDTLLFSTGC